MRISDVQVAEMYKVELVRSRRDWYIALLLRMEEEQAVHFRVTHLDGKLIRASGKLKLTLSNLPKLSSQSDFICP